MLTINVKKGKKLTDGERRGILLLKAMLERKEIQRKQAQQKTDSSLKQSPESN